MTAEGSKGGDWRRTLALIVARPFFALIVLLGRVLPARLLLRIAKGGSRATFALFPGVRRNLLRNASMILGEDSDDAKRRALAKGILASFSRFIVEWVAPKCLVRPEGVFEDLGGREYFDAAVGRGKGIIGITLHMGNYELPGRRLAELGHDVAVVFSRERVSFLERIRSRTRAESRLEEIAIEESRFFAIDVFARLRRGAIVLLAGDQVGAPEAESFPFLHGKAPFSLWPARLAKTSGATILPCFCIRQEDGSYRLVIEEEIEVGEREPHEITEDIVRVLGEYLSRYPPQWLMVHDFWDAD